MKLFKKKSKQMDYKQVAEALSLLEPKRIERLVEIAKDMRSCRMKLDMFVGGRPDDIDKAERALEEIEK